MLRAVPVVLTAFRLVCDLWVVDVRTLFDPSLDGEWMRMKIARSIDLANFGVGFVYFLKTAWL